jgi:1,4-alpha-glucan branching enzyme
METGHIVLALNAHLPFIRRPDYPNFLEERWLFEAISESYLPLLRVFRRLEEDGIPFKLCLSLSPTLISMLQDELLKSRYVGYLERQIQLAQKEAERLSASPANLAIAEMYHRRYAEDLADFVEYYSCDILKGFDFFFKKGRIELITTAATHCLLPLYTDFPETINAQIETAIVCFRKAFGKHPNGFWLPQMGYFPGLERALKAYNLQYTFIASHGLLFGDPSPRLGTFAPAKAENGIAFFGRDLEATKTVWSSETGYPTNGDYREFYRDIGFDLPLEELSPYLDGGTERISTGFKYYAITGKGPEKALYDPFAAARRTREHAADFARARSFQLSKAALRMDDPPAVVCTYDAELFGHWWYEGPAWLEELFRILAKGNDGIRAASPQDFLSDERELQAVRPEFSTWGASGYADVWIDKENSWIYRHTHKAAERIVELAERFPNETGLKERALNQAAREALLSQCSDWPFIMKMGGSPQFARGMVEDSLSNFNKIFEMLSRNAVNTEWLTALEKRNNLFPFINYRMFRKKH